MPQHRRNRTIGSFLALFVALTLSACSHPLFHGPVPQALNAHALRGLDTSVSTSHSFWTTNRLRHALRESFRNNAAISPNTSDPKLSTVGLGEGTPGTGYNFSGIPQTGTFFYTSQFGGTTSYHSCSGSVVNSASGTIVISAAHCWSGVNAQSVVFIPQFSWVNGTPSIPYGIWNLTGNKFFIDSRYEEDNDEYVAYDVAVGTVMPNSAGQTIQEVTGGLDIELNTGIEQSEIEIVGYPASDSDDQTYTAAYPRHCKNSTTTYTEADQSFFYIECTGMASGISGGPWLINTDGQWNLTAVTGGGQNGGGYTNDESVGVPMSDFVTTLIRQAEDFDIEANHNWTQARHMVAGNFGAVQGADDLVVGWLDQAVTLFLGSGQRNTPFLGERTITESRYSGTPLRMLTTADLDASGRDDIVSLMADGRLLLFQDPGTIPGVGPLLLNPHVALNWTKARQIVGGNFSPGDSDVADDLLVVWDDGSTSVYLHISKHGLGRPMRWPAQGLKGFVGARGGESGPLANGINGAIAAGNFGGGELTDLLATATDTNGNTSAWLITDGSPVDGAPHYRISAFNIEAAGINPADIVSMAAGDFDSHGSSDVILDMRGAGLLLLSDVSKTSTPRIQDVTTIVAGH